MPAFGERRGHAEVLPWVASRMSGGRIKRPRLEALLPARSRPKGVIRDESQSGDASDSHDLACGMLEYADV